MARLPWPERLLSRIEKHPSGCWFLTPGWAKHREGRVPETSLRQNIMLPSGKQEPASCAIYRLFIGPTPADLGKADEIVLHVMCGELRCVNPYHRVPVSRSEACSAVIERKRGFNPLEVCARGHLRSEHGYRTPSGKLRCRACETATRRAHRHAHPEINSRAYARQVARRRGLSEEIITLLEHQPPLGPDFAPCPRTQTSPPDTP